MCQELGRALLVVELPDATDPGVFVASVNVLRRHLTPGQAISVFDELVKHSPALRARLGEIEERAKARRGAGLKQGKARSEQLTGTGAPGERIAHKAALVVEVTGKAVSPATLRRHEKRQAMAAESKTAPATLPPARAKLPATSSSASRPDSAPDNRNEPTNSAIRRLRKIRRRVPEPVARSLDALDHVLAEGLKQLKNELALSDHAAAYRAVSQYLAAKAVEVGDLGKRPRGRPSD